MTAVASRRAVSRSTAEIIASVSTKLSVVARFGAIIPAPLVQPISVTFSPPALTVRRATLRARSVVRIPSANDSKPPAWSAGASAAMPGSILAIGSRWPMTPVEATRTSVRSAPSASAVSATMRRASARPPGPVQALALPLLTTTARTRPLPRRSIARDTRTGAAATRLRVNTAAALAGCWHAIIARSGAPLALIPARMAPLRKPRHVSFIGPTVASCGFDALQRTHARPALLTPIEWASIVRAMLIGVPKEIKTQEFRVGMTPAGVQVLVNGGHKVVVERGAGVGSGLSDDSYAAAGAEIVDTKEEVWKRADMVVKVKEPIAPEFPLMRDGQLLFTYLHLAAAQELGAELIKRKVNGVAYETIEVNGQLPLLTPMSAVAGRMAVQAGAYCLERMAGGKGILLGGVPGVRRGRVAIIGAGVVGANAARMAIGLGAQVTVLDINHDVLAYLDDVYEGRISTMHSDPHSVEEAVIQSDLVVGAVLVTGARAPRLVTEAMVEKMEAGSVIVNVAVDQGGCVETCHPTTHSDPTFVVHDVIHYCVANMPGAVPRTSTYALTNATLKYVVALANKGLEQAATDDPAIAAGINTYQGTVPHRAVAEALGTAHTPFRA